MSGFIHEETPTYSTGALVSDIGGALGLLLGLSILDLVMFSSSMVKKLCSGIFYVKRSLTRRRVVT